MATWDVRAGAHSFVSHPRVAFSPGTGRPFSLRGRTVKAYAEEHLLGGPRLAMFLNLAKPVKDSNDLFDITLMVMIETE